MKVHTFADFTLVFPAAAAAGAVVVLALAADLVCTLSLSGANLPANSFLR